MEKDTATYMSDPTDSGGVVILQSVPQKTFKAEKKVERSAPIVVAPDGGYGWVILIASFMVNVIVDGIIFSFGKLIGPLKHDFNASESSVTWVGSMQAGFYLLAGPIVSGLCNKYGARKITVIGSVIAAASIALCSAATQLWHMIILYGLVSGIGYGFVYLPAIVIVGEYFEKRRSLATGIAVAGSGIGGFIFPNLLLILLEEYTWRGTMFILAGITLNCAVFGALFRPLKATHRPEEVDTELQRSESFVQRIQDARDARIRMLNSDVDVAGELEDGSKAGTHAPLLSEHGHMARIIESNEPSTPPYGVSTTTETVHVTGPFRQSSINSRERRFSSSSRKSVHSNTSTPFQKPDIFYSGSIHNLPEVKLAGGVQEFRASVNAVSRKTHGKDSFPRSAMRIISQMLDFSLLKSPTFLLTCVCSFMILAAFFIPFVFIAEFVAAQNLPEPQPTHVLTAISITNTIGRVVVGFISDLPKVEPILIASSALVLGGAANICVPWLQGFALLVTFSLVFGLSISAFAALRSIILVDLFGIVLLNNSFGLQMLFQGLGTLVGTPIAGTIKEVTGSYNGAFYLGGALLLISGLLMFPAKLVQRWEQAKFSNAIKK